MKVGGRWIVVLRELRSVYTKKISECHIDGDYGDVVYLRFDRGLGLSSLSFAGDANPGLG